MRHQVVTQWHHYHKIENMRKVERRKQYQYYPFLSTHKKSAKQAANVRLFG